MEAYPQQRERRQEARAARVLDAGAGPREAVVGDGARDRGALADQISPLPETGAGVAYIRLEASPDPVRARAGHVTDTDIRDMAALAAAGSEAA